MDELELDELEYDEPLDEPESDEPCRDVVCRCVRSRSDDLPLPLLLLPPSPPRTVSEEWCDVDDV